MFVWDFHGTLEEGNEKAVTVISNMALNAHGYPNLFTNEICEMYYGRRWSEYFEHVLPNLNAKQYEELQETAFGISNSNPDIVASYIRPTKYSHEVLSRIGDVFPQVLISNTKADSLEMFINAVGINGFFPEGKRFAVEAHSGAKTKFDVLSNFIGNQKFRDIIVIGDTGKDIELANQIGGVSYLYVHSYRSFPNIEANYKINDLREVLKQLGS